MKLARLITLSGIDCAGKSTQLALLERALRARGNTRIKVLWFRPGYSPELDALRKLVRQLRPSLLPTSTNPRARERAFNKPAVRNSWLYLALVDTWLHFGVKVPLAMLFSDAVLCDRYLPDASLDLELKFPERAELARRLIALIGRVCPTPDGAILLNLPYEEMLRRMQEKQEPFPDAPDVRERRYKAYQALVGSDLWTALDAASSREVVHQQILHIAGVG